MDRGAAGGISSDHLNHQLPGLEQVDENSPVGIDENGRIVQKTDANAYHFEHYQSQLKNGLLAERSAKFARLKDRKIMEVPIPDTLTMKSVRNALKVFSQSKQATKEAIKRYFPDALLFHTQQHDPELFGRIQVASTDQLGDLLREARTKKEDMAFEQQLAQTAIESTKQPPAPQSPPPAHKEQTHTPPASPVAVKISPHKKDLFDKAKNVLGVDLSDEAIALGIERNVFNMIELFPVEIQQRAIEQDKDKYRRSIRALQEPSGRSTQGSSARQPVKNIPSAPPQTDSVPNTHTGLQSIPEDVRPITDMLLKLNYSNSSHFNNAAWQLGRINTKTQGRLDSPVLLSVLDQIIEKITASEEYKRDRKYYAVMKDAADKLPDSQFQRRTLQRLRQQPSEKPAPVQPAQVISPHASPTPVPRSQVLSDSKASPVFAPVPPQPTVVERLGPKHQLSPADMRILTEVFGDSRNETEVENALTACDYLYNQGCHLPFDFLLRGLKQNPGEAQKIVSYRAGPNQVMNKKIAEPFLRHCVLNYAGLNAASADAKNYLTTFNLWHQRDLLDQIAPLHQMNALYTALNGHPLSPDELAFVLADNQMTPLAASRLKPFMPPQPLVNAQTECRKHPDVRVIAKLIDGSENLPSPNAISVCKDVARYATGTMGPKEYERKKADIDRAMNEISYSWVQHYLDRPELLHTFIGNTIQPRLTDDNIRFLAGTFKQWVEASQYNNGVQFMATLHPIVQRDLRIVYDQLAVANLQNFGKQLLVYEPFISGAVHVQHFKENLEMGLGFMNKEHQQKISAKFRELGVKTGQRTIADGNCGFAAIGMMTGDSPLQVRANAKQVALDMQAYMDHGDPARIHGSSAYQLRVRKAVESFQEKKWIEALKLPGERANLVGVDPNTVDFTKEKRFDQGDLWMSDEDRQYLAVYYGRPIIALAEVDEGDFLFGKFITAEGELKYSLDDNFYEEGLATAKQKNPAPLIVMNMGQYAFAHWMPTEPVPLPRKWPAQKIPQHRDQSEMLASIRQNKHEREQYLASLMHNPDLIPGGQNMLPRVESPRYDDSLGTSSLGQAGAVHAHRRQWLKDLENDPMMSLQIGGIGPEAEKYQMLTQLHPMESQELPDLEQSLSSLSIRQPGIEQLPPQNAAKTPGFRNFGGRTCFCNAGLKQQIAGMTMADIRELKDRAYALKRNHPNQYSHTCQTVYGEKKQIRDGGKRADLMLSFAELAEATLRERSGLDAGNIEGHLWKVHKACYQLGQSIDIESNAFNRYYPNGPDLNFSGRQWDSQEFTAKLLEIVDEDNHLSSPISQGYIIQTTDGSNLTKERTGTPQTIMSVPIDGRGLEACLARKKEAMEQAQWVRFSDGNDHAADKTDFLVHPHPQMVQRLNIQAKAFTTNKRTGADIKLTNEARNLVLKHPFEHIHVPLVNKATDQTEKVPVQIKSIVAHIGDAPDAGHYVAFEKQGDQWYLYDDSHTSPVDINQVFASNPGMIPYIFQYERVN